METKRVAEWVLVYVYPPIYYRLYYLKNERMNGQRDKNQSGAFNQKLLQIHPLLVGFPCRDAPQIVISLRKSNWKYRSLFVSSIEPPMFDCSDEDHPVLLTNALCRLEQIMQSVQQTHHRRFKLYADSREIGNTDIDNYRLRIYETCTVPRCKTEIIFVLAYFYSKSYPILRWIQIKTRLLTE